MSQQLHHFTDAQLTLRKRRELEIKKVEKRISAAEDEMRDFAIFMCSVSPEQTLRELIDIQKTLTVESPSFAAIKKLATDVRSLLAQEGSLDDKAIWNRIASVAEETVAVAVRRNYGTSRATNMASRDSPPLPQNMFLEAPYPRPDESSTASIVARTLSSTARRPPMLLSPSKDDDGTDPLVRRKPSSIPEEDLLEYPIAPQLDNPRLSAIGAPYYSVRSSPPAAAPERLSFDRRDGDAVASSGVSKVENPDEGGASHISVDEFQGIEPVRTVPLTSRAIAQREILAVEALYEARLDEAHRQWREERQELHRRWREECDELAARAQANEALLIQRHRDELDLLGQQWKVERESFESQIEALRASLRQSKDEERTLHDGMDKLRQVIHVLTTRLETAEREVARSEQQHEAIHNALRTVALSVASPIPPPIDEPLRRGSRAKQSTAATPASPPPLPTAPQGSPKSSSPQRTPSPPAAEQQQHHQTSFSSYATVSPTDSAN